MEVTHKEIKAAKVTITLSIDEAWSLEVIMAKVWNHDSLTTSDLSFAQNLDVALETAREAALETAREAEKNE